MEYSRIEACIENDYERYVSFLCDICSFEARAADKDVINDMVDYIEKFAKKEGFYTEIGYN